MNRYTTNKDDHLTRLRRIEGPGGPEAELKIREASDAIVRLVKSAR